MICQRGTQAGKGGAIDHGESCPVKNAEAALSAAALHRPPSQEGATDG
jgi:hypothetical protein